MMQHTCGRSILLGCACVVSLVACGSEAVAPDAAPPDSFAGPSTALFSLPSAGVAEGGFFALPFPNDLRIDEQTGKIDLSTFVRPNAIVGEYIDAIAERVNGFGLNSPIFARFDAPIDIASLPPTPQASLDEGAAVYLVNVDLDSPQRGVRTPLRFRFETYAGEAIGDNWLAALPYPGFPLEESTTYALVVTSRVLATDGSAIARSADLDAVFATGTTTDPRVSRARAVYADLLGWLDESGGDERHDVVSAAVFTTQDATSLMGAIREVIRAEAPPPNARAMRWKGEGETHVWYDGAYDGPIFQQGEAPYARMSDGGDIVTDENGKPVLARMETMRFSFTVPKGEVPATGWPVVLYAHGTGGSYHTFRSNGTAERLAQQGLAVISIDQVSHGPRNPQGGSPEIAFFNFQNPLAARDNTLQGALDNFQLVRIVEDFDYTERHPGGRTVRFDPTRIYFFGHSQGGLTGPSFVAFEPMIKGAVFSGAGGLLYLSILLKTEPLDIPSLVGAFIRDVPLDEFNPIIGMLQWWVDRSDPVNFGRRIIVNPPVGNLPKPVYQSEGFTDRYTPPPSIEALATSLELDLVEPVISTIEGLALRGRQPLTAPVTDNVSGVTGVLLQYAEASGSDGHFVVFDVDAAKVQSARFLGSLAETGTATLVAP